jgi:hypothetical protein
LVRLLDTRFGLNQNGLHKHDYCSAPLEFCLEDWYDLID